MKVATIKKRDIAKELTRGYMKLLTQAANGVKVVDDYFIGEDDSEIRPYFYGSLAFGISATLLIILTVR